MEWIKRTYFFQNMLSIKFHESGQILESIEIFSFVVEIHNEAVNFVRRRFFDSILKKFIRIYYVKISQNNKFFGERIKQNMIKIIHSQILITKCLKTFWLKGIKTNLGRIELKQIERILSQWDKLIKNEEDWNKELD
jgi:hypothetical protein